MLKSRFAEARNTQPLDPRWNVKGVANSVCQPIVVLSVPVSSPEAETAAPG